MFDVPEEVSRTAEVVVQVLDGDERTASGTFLGEVRAVLAALQASEGQKVSMSLQPLPGTDPGASVGGSNEPKATPFAPSSLVGDGQPLRTTRFFRS